MLATLGTETMLKAFFSSFLSGLFDLIYKFTKDAEQKEQLRANAVAQKIQVNSDEKISTRPTAGKSALLKRMRDDATTSGGK